MRLTLFILTVSFFISAPVLAQDLEDILLTKPAEDGTLYHLKQVELDACKKTTVSTDFTYMRTANHDSVRLLISMIHPSWKGRPDSLILDLDGAKKLVFPKDDVGILFVTKKKKDWQTRAEILLSEDDFLTLLESGKYSVEWYSEHSLCRAEQPKKIAPLFKEFSTILKYND